MAKINDFSTALQVIPRNESSLPGEEKKREKKRTEEEKDKNVEKERAKEGGREREKE